MEKKLSHLQLSAFFTFLACIISIVLFFQSTYNLLFLVSFAICIFLLCFFFKKINNIYEDIYKIYISGNKLQIDTLSKFTIDHVIKNYLVVNNEIIFNNGTIYTCNEKEHPSFNQLIETPTLVLPKKIKEQIDFTQNQLLTKNFFTNKQIIFSTGSKLYRTFLVDDINRHFAIIEGHDITIKPFIELNSYEIFNSSNKVQVSAREYRTDIHISLVINLKPNLQTPNITINFLNLHESPFPNAAYDIKGALDYIIEYNKNNPS